MSLLANQPSSIAKILDASFKLYAACFKKVIGYGFIIATIYLLMTVATNILIPIDPNSGQPDSLDMEAVSLVMALSFLAAFIAFIFYAAMIYRFDNLVCGREDSFSEALWLGIKKLPAMSWAMILYMLAVMIGMLLLVVPGLILSLSLLFYPFYIVVEGKSGYASLKASHKLVWGNWWRTMAVFIVPTFIMIVLYSIFVVIAVYFEDTQVGSTMPLSGADVFSNLLIGIIVPYFYAIGYVQYQDLKLRTSGGDLEARMAQSLAE